MYGIVYIQSKKPPVLFGALLHDLAYLWTGGVSQAVVGLELIVSRIEGLDKLRGHDTPLKLHSHVKVP